MDTSCSWIDRLLRAVPGDAVAAASDAIATFRASGQPSSESGFALRFGPEVLEIPSRIYVPEPPASTTSLLSRDAAVVLSALFTRHHEGFVRQRHLAVLIASAPRWSPLFVFPLVGEYVVEIVADVHHAAPLLRGTADWSAFFADNPGYLARVKSRAISYWDCYYRNQWLKFRDYPGFLALDALGAWTAGERKRILAG